MNDLINGSRTEGVVYFTGKDIYDDDTSVYVLKRRVGMVFQKPNPFPTMSIYDNVAAGLRLTGASKMGDEAERALKMSTDGFVNSRNSTVSVREISEILGAMSLEVENKAFELIAKYQPVASDLRIIKSIDQQNRSTKNPRSDGE
jgi:ABC-type Fe3+/spermidine/putrescine transport system ATPase subunit